MTPLERFIHGYVHVYVVGILSERAVVFHGYFGKLSEDRKAAWEAWRRNPKTLERSPRVVDNSDKVLVVVAVIIQALKAETYRTFESPIIAHGAIALSPYAISEVGFSPHHVVGKAFTVEDDGASENNRPDLKIIRIGRVVDDKAPIAVAVLGQEIRYPIEVFKFHVERL